MKNIIINTLKQNNIILPNDKINPQFQKIINKKIELAQLITENTTFLQYSASLKVRLQCILQGITQQPICKTCGKIVKMRTNGRYVNTFPDYCHSSCFSSKNEVKEKRSQTNMKKYGNTNVLQSEEIRKKAKQTFVEKYGVDNPLKNEKIREQIKKTNIEKYGHENFFSSDVGREKRKSGMLINHGVEYPIQDENIKQKIFNSMIEKYNGDSDFVYKNFHQLNIPVETLHKINNKQWMYDQHYKYNKTFQKIAKELGVSEGLIARNMNMYNIKPLFQSSSQGERELADYVKQLTDNVVTNTRNVIAPLEIDIYLPEQQLAIEYNGVFWHGETQGKDRRYHLNKTTLCEEKQIRLIQLWDYEWLTKSEIVKSRISSLLGKNKKIYARNTKVVQLTYKQSSTFFEQTHLQGNAPASVSYGLIDENHKIVAAMSFGKARFSKKYKWELIRYSNDLFVNVVGGASKLFKYFIKNCRPASIVTYSDKRWNTGKLYITLGFTFLHTAKPNYYYFNPKDITQIFHRVRFQKHKLNKELDIYNPNKTEWENMQANNYDRIWDCGNDVFTWIAPENFYDNVKKINTLLTF